ncbi:hypothetical protein ZWY2020_040323 [Hordeum vulgare]|nr:hypothetical protein ZWY2020_040323 [Hordeum vulgare]
MTGRCGISSPPLPALALLLLLCFSYSAVAARLLSANTAAHQGSTTNTFSRVASACLRTPRSLLWLLRLLTLRGCIFAGIGRARAKSVDAATTDCPAALKEEGGKAGNGGEVVSPSEATAEGDTTEEAEAEEEACEEGEEGEECMQRRLLHDAHLDYIYTQHKGRP